MVLLFMALISMICEVYISLHFSFIFSFFFFFMDLVNFIFFSH